MIDTTSEVFQIPVGTDTITTYTEDITKIGTYVISYDVCLTDYPLICVDSTGTDHEFTYTIADACASTQAGYIQAFDSVVALDD